MHLKSIEIYGFKSFANKITFKFQEGITAIVGPNGSGKSNIADAVRWVLGEQSAKQLRSSKMEDVIFSGTEVRKPMSYAYVLITMDNSDHKLAIDYEEVTVGRRVYRSGESEYLLNGSVCRLKDITDLFTDTGVGKEGYSIIGQGQIDKVLSRKPEDRRELFDEAAGIGMYKKRKNATQKNLENERKNLVRITDILAEIEKRIEPLKKQSKDAKEYLAIYEELKKLEVNLFIIESDKVRNSKEEIESKTKIVEESLQETRDKHASTRVEYGRLENLLDSYDKEIEKDKNLLSENKINIEKKEGDINLIKEQINSLKNQIKQYQERIESLSSEINIKVDDKDKYIQEKKDIDIQLEAIDEEQISLITQIEEIKNVISDYTKKIETHNNEIISSLNQTSNYKGDLQRYKTILEQNTDKKSEIDEKLLEYKIEKEETEKNLLNLKDKLEKILREINGYKGKTKESEAYVSSIQKDINDLTIEINKRQQEYLNAKSRLESLINLTERYEGYGNSIRKIMDLKENKHGILGVVADIIKVEKKYEIAVETALGGSIQNIVTDNENTAKELINYLKKNRYGRATFLPLTGIRSQGNMSYPNLHSEEGVIGFADSLVEIDSKYQNLAKYLLGRNIVVDNIDNAISLSKKYKQRLRIVTLDGELLNPGGSMSGGAYKNTSNLIGRRREIEDLQKSVKSQGLSLTKFINEKEAKKRQRTDYTEKINSVNIMLQDLELKRNTIELNIEQTSNKIKQIEVAYIEQKDSACNIDSYDEDLQENIKKTKQVLSNSDKQLREHELLIEQTNKFLLEKQEAQNELLELQSSIRVRHSAIEQKKDNVIENIKRIKEENEKLYIDKNNIEKTIEESIKQISQKEQSLEELHNTIREIKADIISLDESVSNKIILKEKESRNYKQIFNEREEISQEINELDKELIRLNNKYERFSNQLDEQINHIWETYELTYTSALGYRDASIDNISVTKKEVSSLKGKIKNLGSVNLDSIEEYKETTTRYEFLSTQKEDLQKSEENLMSIIKELEDGMRKQFIEKFKEIKNEFNIVFKELFGGGTADLELTEGDDLLDAGVVIIAQPPGKKLQNMMQLSGGEKALTAISLLFAIQSLKPSPFCLLDEIEAALDDSNVVRYANYLNKLSKNTQFITITHRRGTMNVADVLYGITMQEKGISTLVAVNLIENQLEN